MIAYTRTPPIIATLGAMYIFIATLFLVIGGTWISGLPNSLSFLVRGAFLGVPAGAWVIAAVYGACWLLLRRMPWGRHVVAVGCDERAARLAGVRVERVKIQAYALLGLLAGVAAVLYVARLRNVEVNIGTNVALEAIAATVLGGASIRGGVGSLLGALLGVLFIKVMQNGLVLVGISSLWETVVIGGLLLIVLASRRHGAAQRDGAMSGGRRLGLLLALTALVVLTGAAFVPGSGRAPRRRSSCSICRSWACSPWRRRW